MRKKILISTSGGRTSAFMARFVNEHPAYKDWSKLFVFANTGKEREETLIFLNEIEKHWGIPIFWVEMKVLSENPLKIGYKMVDFDTASRNGEPFIEAMKLKGLPTFRVRICTDLMKKKTIEAFARDWFGTTKYRTAIGIRADEQHRLQNDKKIIYPLSELGVDEGFIRRWWEQQPFQLNLKDYQGNCDLCFLKSLKKKKTIISENPAVAEWWVKAEERFANHISDRMDYYSKKTVSEIVEETGKVFNPAVDKLENGDFSSLFVEDSDIGFDCFCSSY